jgi:AcrR family transcriptional regulator
MGYPHDSISEADGPSIYEYCGKVVNKRRSDAVRNRALIVDIARRRYDAGDAELPLNVVAAEAGLGVGTVYRNFPTRLALLSALAEPHLADLLQTVRSVHSSGETRAFEKAFRAAVELFGAHAELLRVVASGGLDEDWAGPSLWPLTKELDYLLARAIRAGEVRAEITVEVVNHLLCSIDYAARLSNDPQARSLHADIALRGMRPDSMQSDPLRPT